VVGVVVDVGVGSYCVNGGRQKLLLCTCEVDSRLHLSGVMLDDCHPECILQAGDEEADLVKLAGDAGM
jgi:hypothetical protein